MKLDVAPKPTDALVPTPIVHQTAFWGRVHRRLGFGIDAFDVAYGTPSEPAPRAHGDVLVVRAPLADGAECAYVPFGPELAPDPDHVGTFLERLSRELRPLLGPTCAFIRWDLPWVSLHAREPGDYADDGQWQGPPAPRLRELRMNFGTRDHNLWKAPRDLLPPDTLLVDLTASEDELLARMRPATRRNIRLAERRGVSVHEGTADDLPAWYALYVATMTRNQLEPLPLAHFATLLDERAEGSASPVVTRLLLARHEERLLAGLFLALAPARATYLYGASTRDHADLLPSYALQWAAMRRARAHGCHDYDLFGAAPQRDPHHPLAGVHQFKAGFGGRLVHREGCWDFPYDERTYTAWRTFEQSHVTGRAVGARHPA